MRPLGWLAALPEDGWSARPNARGVRAKAHFQGLGDKWSGPWLTWPLEPA